MSSVDFDISAFRNSDPYEAVYVATYGAMYWGIVPRCDAVDDNMRLDVRALLHDRVFDTTDEAVLADVDSALGAILDGFAS